MKFKQLLEGFNAAQSVMHERFSFGGQPVRSMARRIQSPQYVQSLAEAATFVADVFDGRQPLWMLKEAMSTSDFPLLFGDTIDRLMVAKWKAIEPTWRDYAKISTCRDFRPVKRFRCTRGAALLHGPMSPGESYKGDAVDESYYEYSVGKYGRRRDILWEALVNDDLGALRDAPDDLAWQAVNTEAYEFTRLWAANTTLYAINHAVAGVNYSNLGNAAFDADALAAAIGEMGEYPAEDGESPIMNDPLYIVVGTRTMQMRVEQVLNSLIVAYTGSSDRDNLPVANLIPAQLRNTMQVRLNPWIRLFDTDYQTAWYIFSDPAAGYAVEFSFLQGHELPELFMKNSNQVQMGGGAVSPMEGDFDTDAVGYKLRHCCGGSHTNAVGGWRFTWRSTGTV
ncbi:MAG: hypothetical protein DRJ03_08890 [Chloroflexi bacterium]|nr:MAG: hypothetical protein DRJ03_08890 [Chloroflexota bacterium]